MWDNISMWLCGVNNKVALLVVGKKQREENHFYLTLEEAWPDLSGACNWGWIDEIFRVTGVTRPIRNAPIIIGETIRECTACTHEQSCKAKYKRDYNNKECYLCCDKCWNGPKPDFDPDSTCVQCLRCHGYHLKWEPKEEEKIQPIMDGPDRKCETCGACGKTGCDRVRNKDNRNGCILQCSDCIHGPEYMNCKSPQREKCISHGGFRLNWTPKEEPKKRFPIFDGLIRSCAICASRKQCDQTACRLKCVECGYGPECNATGKAECKQCIEQYSYQLLFQPKPLSKELEIPEDDRCCQNCEYVNRSILKKPCDDCDEDNSQFKPAYWYLEKLGTFRNEDHSSAQGVIKFCINTHELNGPIEIAITPEGEIGVRTKIE